MREPTRRTFLRGSAAVATLAVVPTVGAADRVWTNAETPIDVSLYDVERTADGEYVGGGGRTVFHWDGGEWVREDTGDTALRDVEMDGARGLAVGGCGAVFRRKVEG